MQLLTPTGWPSYYPRGIRRDGTGLREAADQPVVEACLDLHRDCAALLESDSIWLPAHLWRFDKEWRNLRRLVPWVKRAPSEYIREHVRVAIQPLDPPPSTRQLLEVVDQLGSEDVLLYSSDYPHQHAFDPETELLPHLSEGLRRKIRVRTPARFTVCNPRRHHGDLLTVTTAEPEVSSPENAARDHRLRCSK